jgi:hypothetical protein
MVDIQLHDSDDFKTAVEDLLADGTATVAMNAVPWSVLRQ